VLIAVASGDESGEFRMFIVQLFQRVGVLIGVDGY
jgi:hypothetical protein